MTRPAPRADLRPIAAAVQPLGARPAQGTPAPRSTIRAGVWIVGMLAILVSASQGLAGPAAAPEAAVAPARPRVPAWQEVSFTATKFLLRASTTARVELVPTEEVAARVRTPGQGKGTPVPAGGLLRVAVSVDMPFNRSEEAEVLLDPDTGAAVQAEKVTSGRRTYRKVYRFTRQGVFVWRTAPANPAEAAGDPRHWSRKMALLEPLDRPLPEGASLVDTYSLFGLVSLHPFARQGESHTHHILAGDRLVELTFTAGGLTTANFDFDEVTADGKRRRAETIVVRPVTVSGRAVADPGDSRDVELGFLGMRGSLTVLLEADSGIPLELSGRADRVGHLVVRLTRLVRRGN